MIIRLNGVFDPYAYRLGVATNHDNVDAQAEWVATQWAPKNAKSFTVSDLTDTDYDGNASPVRTGYASFKAAYFTTVKEGKTPL